MNQEESQADRLGARDWLLVATAALLTTILCVLASGNRGFWLDEFYTLDAVRLPAGELIEHRLEAGHSPLPFLYAKVFWLALGESTVLLRLSSALMAGLATVALALLTAELGWRRLLPVVLLISVFHPYWQVIGTLFRYMMPLTALAGFWWWSALSHWRVRSWRSWTLTVALGAVCLWIHGSAQMVFLSVLVLLHLLSRNDRQSLRLLPQLKLLSAPLSSFVLSIPLLVMLQQFTEEGESASANIPSVRLELMNQMKSFFGDDDLFYSVFRVPDDIFTTLFLAVHLAAAAIVIVFCRREKSEPASSFFLSSLLGIPIVVMLITLTIQDAQGPTRYVAFLSVPIVLLFAKAWDLAAHWNKWGIGFRALFILATMMAFTMQALNRGEGHREGMLWLKEHRTPDQPIATLTGDMNILALDFYGIDGGVMQGIDARDESEEGTAELIREPFENADSGFLFLYHEGLGTPVDEALEILSEEGFFSQTKEWAPTRKVRVIAVARNEEGEAALEALKEGPPAPWPTDQPHE